MTDVLVDGLPGPVERGGRVNSGLTGDGCSRLPCFDSQLAITTYQGEYASLPVRGDDQLALKAK